MTGKHSPGLQAQFWGFPSISSHGVSMDCGYLRVLQAQGMRGERWKRLLSTQLYPRSVFHQLVITGTLLTVLTSIQQAQKCLHFQTGADMAEIVPCVCWMCPHPSPHSHYLLHGRALPEAQGERFWSIISDSTEFQAEAAGREQTEGMVCWCQSCGELSPATLCPQCPGTHSILRRCLKHGSRSDRAWTLCSPRSFSDRL